MGRLVIVIAAVFLFGVGEAPAATITSGSHPYQRWADEAKVPTVDAVVHEVACPTSTTPGCALGGQIWMPPDYTQPKRLFLHELGHLYDEAVLTTDDRAWFMARVFRDGRAWYQGPIELFAELYRRCAVRATASFNNQYQLPGSKWVRAADIDRGCAHLRS